MLLFAGMGYLWMKETGILAINGSSLSTITEFRPVDNTIIYDAAGGKIGEVFNKYHVLVPYEQLPQDLVNAIVSIEDRSFFEHIGVDMRGIARAVYDRVRGARLKQGASTITQQLVRHFLLTKEKTIERKLREAILSVMLETKMSKNRIMELYTNVLFLGNGSYGVGAAAKRYFDRPLSQLQVHELAMIAGLFQSPSRYNPQRYPDRAKKRQLQVLRAMHASGFLTTEQYMHHSQQPLEYKTYRPVSNKVAPYFIDFVRDEAKGILGEKILNKGLRIYTTLDRDLQKMAQESMQERQDAFDLAERMVIVPYRHKGEDPEIQGAMLTADHHTGGIKAMVGGRDYQKSKFNRTTQAMRQPGSSFKPIVYSLALNKGRRWSDLIYVAPVAINEYRPRNFSNNFMTETTMLRAFYRSVNTPAVEIASELGAENIVNHAYNLGISSKLKVEIGTALGGSDVTMTDMLQVYATMANKGVKTKLYAIEKITDRDDNVLYTAPSIAERSSEAMSPQDAYLITEGMRAVFRYGTAFSQNDMAAYAVGKTGTSNKAKDNWFCGFTDKLATVVWVGSDRSFDFMGKATGTSLALPIWATYMRKAVQKYPPGQFERPPGIVVRRVHSSYGYLSADGHEMFFKAGNLPTRSRSALKVLSETGKYRSIFDN